MVSIRRFYLRGKMTGGRPLDGLLLKVFQFYSAGLSDASGSALALGVGVAVG